MSLEFRPPDRISLSGNLADNWRLWKQGFMLFMTATESDGKVDKIKFAMLLASIGPEALDRFNQFTFDAASGEDRESYDQVLLKFENHCVLTLPILDIQEGRTTAVRRLPDSCTTFSRCL